MSKKVTENNHKVFALTTDTLAIKKYPTNAEGEILDTNFNAKTYTKKAYAAYLRGDTYFKYKDQVYIVPKMSRTDYTELLESVNEDGTITPKEQIEEVSNEIKNIETW